MLITLAIIGVVAALTIPAVVNKVTKEQYVVGLKKAYNTVKAVEREATQEYGEPVMWSDWDSLSSSQAVEKYFIPYFDVMKNCGFATDTSCFHGSNETKYLNGSNNPNGFNALSNYYTFISSDGMLWAFWKATSLAPPARLGYFYADVNGKKAPNTVGRDIFGFNFFPNKGFVPYGIHPTNNENTAFSTEQREGSAKYACNKNCTSDCGWWCSGKVLGENAMNY